EVFAKGYSVFAASITRSAMNDGTEKRHSMKNAVAYSLRQAKFDNPERNCAADSMEVARKKAKLKQKMLKVKIRCPQRSKNLLKGRGRVTSSPFLAGGQNKRSRDKTTPWMAPKITNVQLAPCQSPARTMVIIRFLQVCHLPPRLPPRGMYK